MSSATTKISLISTTAANTKKAGIMPARSYLSRSCRRGIKNEKSPSSTLLSKRKNDNIVATKPSHLIRSTITSRQQQFLSSSSSSFATSFSTSTNHNIPPPKPIHINPFNKKNKKEEKMQSMVESIFASAPKIKNEMKEIKTLQRFRKDALKASRYYSKNPRGSYLTIRNPASLFIHAAQQQQDEIEYEKNSSNEALVMRMSGARICDELLHFLFLPTTTSSSTTDQKEIIITKEEELDALLEMCLLTITAYAKESKPGATYSGGNHNPMENAQRAESILNMLYSIPILYKKQKEERIDKEDEDDNNLLSPIENEMPEKETLTEKEKLLNRQKTLLYILNSTLDTYAKAADSALGAGPKASRDAALRAEYLLLEAVNRADDGDERQLGTISEIDDEDSVSTITLPMVSPDVVSFNTVITAWATSGRSSSASKRRRKNGRGKKKGRPLADEIATEETATAAAERAEAMLKLMQELSDNNNNGYIVHPSRYSYDAVIRAWGRSPHPDASNHALAILTDMIERSNKYKTPSSHDNGATQQSPPPPFPNLRTFTSVIKALANSRSPDAPDKAESILENMEEFARRSSPRLGGMGNDSVRDYDDMEEENDFDDDNDVRPSVYNYNVVLSTFMKAPCRTPEERYRMCIRIDELIAKMERLADVGGQGSRVRPDHITRGTAISSWAQCANVFRKRREKEETPRKRKSNKKRIEDDRKWAESCAERAHDHLLAGVEQWRKGGNEHGKKNIRLLNIHSFNDVINAYGCALLPEKAKEVFELAFDLQPHVRPEFVSYKGLIDAFVDCASADINAASQAEEYLMEMQRKFAGEGATYVKPDRHVYNSVLAGWARSSDPKSADRAYDLLMNIVTDYEKELKSRKNEAVRPNTTSFAHVMSALSKLDEDPTERMENLVSMMEKMHEERRACSSPSDHRVVAHVTPNVILYNMLLRAYANRSRNNIPNALKAEKLLNRMNELCKTGINTEAAPDRYSLAAVLKAYSNSRLKDAGKKAIEILHLVHDGSGRVETHGRNEGEPLADTIVYNSVLSTLAQSGHWRSAQQAEDVLQKMEEMADTVQDESGEEVADSLPRPDVSSYTSVISAWSNTKTIEGAQRAEALLDRLLERSKKAAEEAEKAAQAVSYAVNETEKAAAWQKRQRCSVDVRRLRPDADCYIAVIRAYAKLRTREGMQMAEAVMKRMENAAHAGDETLRPSTKAFNTLMYGWASCREINDTVKGNDKSDVTPFSNAQRAEDILKHMIQLYESGYSGALPESKTFSVVLHAWLGSKEPDAIQHAIDALYRKIEFHSVDKSIFAHVNDLNAVLKKLSEDSDGKKEATEKVAELSEALLERMVAHYKETGKRNAAPNEISYNTVLNTFVKVRQEGYAQKAEDLLNRMEANANDGSGLAFPKTVTYRTCMNAWATSKEVGSAEKTEALLKRFQERSKIRDPNTFNLVLKACATSPPSDESDPFSVAVHTFHRMRESDDPSTQVTHASYSFMFIISNKHLPDNHTQRRNIFMKLFEECCEDGLVSSFVVDAIRQSVSDDIFVEMFGKTKESDMNMDEIPADWKRNVPDKL